MRFVFPTVEVATRFGTATMIPPDPSNPPPQGPGGARGAGSVAVRIAGGILTILLVVAIWHHWNHETFLMWRENAGPVPFFLSLAILPALGVPATPFYILAGATFGTATALVGSIVALAANLALCYWISVGALRPRLEKWLARSRHHLPSFEGRDGRGACRFTLLVKLAPGVPTFVKNYLLSLAGVPFGIYFGLSLLITGFYAAAFVLLGESALDRDPAGVAAAAAVLVLAGGTVWWLRRHRQK